MEHINSQSEEKYKNLVELASDIMYISDREGNYTFLNEAAYELLEVTSKEVIGRPWVTTTHPEDIEKSSHKFNEMIERGIDVFDYESRFVTKSGREIHALHNIKVLRNENGEFIGSQGIARDITERKRTEEKLQKQMLLNKQILQTTLDGYILADTDGKLLDVNPAYCEMIGYSWEELLKMNIQALEVKLSPPEIEKRIERMVKQGKDRFETKHKRKDGRIIDLEVSSVIMHSDETPLVAAFVRDITKRKIAEDTLRESEAKWRSLTENSPDHILLLDRNLIIRFINYTVSGSPVEKVIGNHISKFIPKKSWPEMIKCFERVLKTGKPDGYEMEYPSDDKLTLSFEGRVRSIMHNDEVISLLVIATNITDRKQAEEALRKSETKHKSLLQNIPGMVYAANTDWSAEIICNAAKICGYTAEEINSLETNWLSIIHPDDKEAVFQTGAELSGTQKDLVQSYRIITKDGHIRWVEDRKRSIFNQDGEFNGIDGIVFDITERKIAEDALRESKVKWRTFSENSPDHILLLDRNLIIRFMNYTASGLPVEKVVGNHISKFTPKKYWPEMKKCYERVWKTGKPDEYEMEYPSDGTLTLTFEGRVRSIIHNDEVVSLLVIATNITERKQIEKELRESQENLSLIYDTVGDMIFRFEVEPGDCFRFISVNQAFLDQTGLTEEQVIGKRIEEVRPKMSHVSFLNRYKEAIRENKIVRWEETSVFPTGELIGEVTIAPVLNEKGICTHLIGSVHDITERKKAEEALRLSVDELKSLNSLSRQLSANLPFDRVVQAALDGMNAAIAADLTLLFLLEGDSLFLKGFKPKGRKKINNAIPVHRVGECLCGLAVKEGKTIYSLNIHQDKRCTWDECIKAGFASFCAIPIYSGENILGVLGLASFSERDFRKQANFLETLSNEVATSLQNALLFQQVQHHATELESQVKERKKTDTALRKSTARLQALSHRLLEVQETERRTIAHELHDEIGQTLTALKINLQIVQSQITSTLSQKQMEESVHMVEQALQQTRDLSLDLRPSILDDLGLLPALRWYVDRQSQRTGITVELTANKLKTSLPPEVEIACFRIIQEALTNVTRHSKAKQVWIELSEVNKKFQMVVRDDGVGFDVNAAYKRASLGASMGLLGMEERAQLAGGKIEIQSQHGKGTEIKVYLP